MLPPLAGKFCHGDAVSCRVAQVYRVLPPVRAQHQLEQAAEQLARLERRPDQRVAAVQFVERHRRRFDDDERPQIDLLPAQLDMFSAEVIPILQRRGLFRTEYRGTTLREHYGLSLPVSVFDDPAWTAEPLEAVAGV